jgi:WD40 repeat protein
MLGTTKGEIYFVDIESRTHYYTKVYFHTSEVVFIREISLRGQSEVFFLSMSQDKQIVVWKVGHQESPAPLVTLSYNREFSYKDLFENFMVLGEKTGELSIIEIVPQGHSVRFWKSSSANGHLRAVICGDFMRYGGSALFLSGGEDSVIKIWRGVEKQLLFQLKLFGFISAASFTRHRIDLIVCHNEQISILKDEKLKSLRKACSLLPDPHPETTSVEEIDPRTFFFHSQQTSPPNRHPRLHRLTSKYTNLFHKMSVREEGPEPLKELRLEAMSSLPPTLAFNPIFQRLESLQVLPPKTKRFHLNSSMEGNEVSLPRINTKNSVYEKILPMAVRVEEGLQELKQRKNKSYSTAGKQSNT